MKILLVIAVLIIALLFYQKAIVIDITPVKNDIKALRKAAAWVAAKFKALKSKFTKKS